MNNKQKLQQLDKEKENLNLKIKIKADKQKELGREITKLSTEIKRMNDRIHNIEIERKELVAANNSVDRLEITDHAIVRFLQYSGVIDLEKIKNDINISLKVSNCNFDNDDLSFIFEKGTEILNFTARKKDNTIVTILTREAKENE